MKTTMEGEIRKPKSIKEIIQQNIILQGADLLSAKGFTQIPNHVLRGSLSPGAKLTYSMLLSYAWHNNFAFPGQRRLSEDMGVTERSVITYMKELKEKRYLQVKRQGQGKTNRYILSLRSQKKS